MNKAGIFFVLVFGVLALGVGVAGVLMARSRAEMAEKEVLLAREAASRQLAEVQEEKSRLLDPSPAAADGHEPPARRGLGETEAILQSIDMLDERIDELDETLNRRVTRLWEELDRLKAPAAPEDPGVLTSRLREEGVRLDVGKKTVEVDGFVIQREVLIEFVAVTGRGKTHESLFLLDCAPRALNAGLLALGLAPGTPYRLTEEALVPEVERGSGEPLELEDPETGEMKRYLYFPPRGDGVEVTVSWEDEKGGVVRHRIEELILDATSGKALAPMSWVYLGSRFQRNPDTGEEVYVADLTGDVISIWHSYQGNTILDNPLLVGRDDEIFFAFTDRLPPEGTRVQITFRREER